MPNGAHVPPTVPFQHLQNVPFNSNGFGSAIPPYPTQPFIVHGPGMTQPYPSHFPATNPMPGPRGIVPPAVTGLTHPSSSKPLSKVSILSSSKPPSKVSVSASLSQIIGSSTMKTPVHANNKPKTPPRSAKKPEVISQKEPSRAPSTSTTVTQNTPTVPPVIGKKRLGMGRPTNSGYQPNKKSRKS